MTTRGKSVSAVIVTSGTILVACGGHDNNCCYYGSYGSSCSYSGACYPYANGAYRGTMSSPSTGQKTPVIAVLGPGAGQMSGQDGSQYQLTLDPAGSTVRGGLSGFSPTDSLANDSRNMDASISGTLKGGNLNAEVTDQAGDRQALTLHYAGSSNSTLDGTWAYSLNGYSISVKIDNGAMIGTDSKSCSYRGTVRAVGPQFTLYRAQFQQVCDSVSNAFDGYLAPVSAAQTGSNPAQAQVVMLADDNEGNFLSITLARPKS